MPVSKPTDPRLKMLGIHPGDVISEKYVVMAKPGDDGEPHCLGGGGSGVVVAARQELVEGVHIDRAIKLFMYQENIADQQKSVVAYENFDREIKGIASVNHQNVLKVVDGGYLTSRACGDGEDSAISVPFEVMEYIEGGTLQDLIDRVEEGADELSEVDFFDIAVQFAAGVAYLHSRDFYHFDIAPKNVFVNKSRHTRYHVVLGDLGAGMTLARGAEGRQNDEVFLIGTRDYAPEAFREQIREVLPKSEVAKMQPAWDIYGTRLSIERLGKALLAHLTDPSETHSSVVALLEYLRVRGDGIRSARQLATAINHIRPEQRVLAEVKELTATSAGMESRRIPPTQVYISKRIEQIVNHRSFARLKDVDQLFTMPAKFPSANNTRLEHALGTYEMMRKVMVRLQGKPSVAPYLDKETIELALLGALLSGVAQSPLTYVIRDLRSSSRGGGVFRQLSHHRFFEKAMHSRLEGPVSLWGIVRAYFPSIQWEDLNLVVCGTEGVPAGTMRPEVQFVHSLLRSTIDVRVLDFLMRDAYHIGRESVPDFSQIIDHLEVVDNRVAVSTNGVTVVEQVVTQRYWMFKTVYWNEPNRLYHAVLRQVLFELRSKGLCEDILNGFMHMSSASTPQCLREWAEKAGRTDVSEFVEGHLMGYRPKFKRIYTVNAADSNAALSCLCGYYAKMSLLARESFRKELEKVVLWAIGEDGEKYKGKIVLLVDMPESGKGKLGEDISVVLHDKRAVQLKEKSGIVSGICLGFDEQLRWLRIWLRSDLYGKFVAGGQETISLVKDFMVAYCV